MPVTQSRVIIAHREELINSCMLTLLNWRMREALHATLATRMRREPFTQFSLVPYPCTGCPDEGEPWMLISGLLTGPLHKRPPFQNVKIRDPATQVKVPNTLALPLDVFNLSFSILDDKRRYWFINQLTKTSKWKIKKIAYTQQAQSWRMSNQGLHYSMHLPPLEKCTLNHNSRHLNVW